MSSQWVGLEHAFDAQVVLTLALTTEKWLFRIETIAKSKIRLVTSVGIVFRLGGAVLRSPVLVARVCADCGGGGVSVEESRFWVRGGPGLVAASLDAGKRERFWSRSSTLVGSGAAPGGAAGYLGDGELEGLLVGGRLQSFPQASHMVIIPAFL